ncbi:UDP-N-acetylmuramoyl-tripeptide--D-alanyl-D-alanine ligase [bacterium]|nr:UDP-N-acetylmuramoyl-tripeptide--D-alanyl-D-alanine ligase [bacterium]MCB2179355.1 UDP-N-acetylmuramoyl-tripeptide--D-alanyl-D-alanine ligase [bacterium]
MLKLADVIEALCMQRPNNAEKVITQAVIDSRVAIPGCIFFAIPGERVDGHNYIGHAFEQGASFALVEKDMSAQFRQLDLRQFPDEAVLADLEEPFCLLVENTVTALQEIARFWRSRLDVVVVGITGSVGKSTTKELVAEVLSHRYPTLKNEGNYNNEIGLPITILSLTEGHQRAVLEMGFYVPGEIRFLCEIARPKIGVVTNIGTVHAERAGSQEMIAAGKAELVESLPVDGTAVLNYDDPLVRAMADKTSARVLFYGLNDAADVWADQVEGLGLEGIRFRLHYRNETLHLKVPMLGRHSVHTALRAAAVGLADGLDWHEIISGLRFGHMQLRLMAVRSSSGALLLDDTYNASPQSTLAALNLLEELDGRKIAVLGDMLELGQYERQGHEMVGIRASEIAEMLITVGGRGHMIAESARSAGMPLEKIVETEDTEEATQALANILGPEDVVLIKGSRGMRMDAIAPALEAVS